MFFDLGVLGLYLGFACTVANTGSCGVTCTCCVTLLVLFVYFMLQLVCMC